MCIRDRIYDEREELMGVDENGVPIMRALERMVLLLSLIHIFATKINNF